MASHSDVGRRSRVVSLETAMRARRVSRASRKAGECASDASARQLGLALACESSVARAGRMRDGTRRARLASMQFALLTLASLSACSVVDGTVLRSRSRTAPDSGVRFDSGTSSSDAAARDAAVDDAASRRDASDSIPDASSGNDARTSDDDSSPDTRGVCRVGGSRDGFYENFNGTSLDPTRWLVAHGPVRFGGAAPLGGFARDNVQVRDGALHLLVRGDRYQGDVRAIDATGKVLATGKRSAAAIVSRDLFGSGTYQVQGFLSGPAAVEFAIWFVRDDDAAGAIDLTSPGTSGGARDYGYVRLRTRDATTANDVQFALGKSLDDGASHILRFDWYTTASKSASFWIDDMLRAKSMRSLPPSNAGRLWIVAWVRDDAAADFDTAEIRLDNAFVTPFGNDGDTCTDGELKGPSLTPP